MAQCTATSKQTKKRCRRPAIRGGTVCRFHGGGAPQVKRKAEERLAMLVDPAIDALTQIVKAKKDSRTRLGAARDILDRTGHARPVEFASGFRFTIDLSESPPIPEKIRKRKEENVKKNR